ncbi:MAG TPA: YigZ family protein [Bacilli bacterium]|nr:YigZ family protein [Bacilli bacterium]HOR52852.1 YigZ family protein [Bacilli bacterium]HPL58772.1 YigZ family protein [Bacilli bacterium]
MKRITEAISNQIIIKKSEFICTLIPVNNVSEAQEQLAALRKKYYDATHNCYAYIVEDGIKYSDDGEPSQTAGLPIYNVLEKNELTNILAVVTRYFGGIMLGAGGLVRAYTKSTTEALAVANIVEINTYQKILITIDYSKVDILINKLNDETIEREFGKDVKMTYLILENQVEPFINQVRELTNGDLTIELLEKSTF